MWLFSGKRRFAAFGKRMIVSNNYDPCPVVERLMFTINITTTIFTSISNNVISCSLSSNGSLYGAALIYYLSVASLVYVTRWQTFTTFNPTINTSDKEIKSCWFAPHYRCGIGWAIQELIQTSQQEFCWDVWIGSCVALLFIWAGSQTSHGLYIFKNKIQNSLLRVGITRS